MHHLLVWPLSDNLKIIFSSSVADLSTITCCDTIDLALHHNDTSYVVCRDMTGCSLSKFKHILQQIHDGSQTSGRFCDTVMLGCDQLGNILVEIRDQYKPLSYSVVPRDTLQAWAAQLDLLQVVMEENENEKKSRGTGCCG